MDFEKIEKKLGFHFNNSELLKQAFTHRSYLNENRKSGVEHNERLEFLGDAVLELVVTEYLYKLYPNKNEGDLTALRSALVNTVSISEVALGLGFNDFLLLSRGEAKDTGRARQYILANTFEAVVGAMFLDLGYEAAQTFIDANLIPTLGNIIEKGTWMDAKSKLQEIVQDKFGVTPRYETVKEVGPDHDKTFTIAVFFGDEKKTEGSGKSKQEAEQEAARKIMTENKWG
jgi:ribonuclease III